MKQYEAVIKVMEANGGYATLGQLNQRVFKEVDCEWDTKTPFASIRRIVQDKRFFFKIKPGLWALETFKHKLPPEIYPTKGLPEAKLEEYSHAYYQGLLVELGNFRKYQTFIPRQDKNKSFLGRKLSDIANIADIYVFSYPRIIEKAQTIDVTWFNHRNMPDSFFEIEHSTDINNSLLKFVELQDFYTNFYIVADEHRHKEFEKKKSVEAFKPVSERVSFWNYEYVAKLHTKTSELINIELEFKL
ncbi:MAG: hypothetical protein ACYCSZ_15060 [Burkholderiales bacterium]